MGGRPILLSIDVLGGKTTLTLHPRVERLKLLGSGTRFVRKGDPEFKELSKLVAAYDENRLAAVTVADRFARINSAVSTRDVYVSSECIVLWRNAHPDTHREGSGHQAYAGAARDPNASFLVPTLGGGMPISDIAAVLMPEFMKLMEAGGNVAMPWLELDAKIAQIATEPDEKLR